METFSFNEDHGIWEEYLNLKPVIADGKTNRGYWVRYLFMVWLPEFTISQKQHHFCFLELFEKHLKIHRQIA